MHLHPDQYRDVIQRHQAMVFSIALRVLGDFGAAEETAQDVFLELFRSADRLESEHHLRFWLRRVSVHRATDALRSRTRRPEAHADQWLDETHTPIPDGRISPLEARLDEMLQSLPPSQRVAIVLRYTESMTPDEIAQLLHQPVATVKSNLQRGLSLLRRKAAVTMKEFVRHAN